MSENRFSELDVNSLTAELPAEEKGLILGIGSMMRAWEVRNKIDLAQHKIEQFESKYGTSLSYLQKHGLPIDADFRMHEDFVEWEYWVDILFESRKTLKTLNNIMGATNVSSE